MLHPPKITCPDEKTPGDQIADREKAGVFASLNNGIEVALPRQS
jgi:hypothetical protein